MKKYITKIKKDSAENTKDKILLVINCLKGGGAERVVLTLGQGFYDLGYEVHVLRFKSQVEYDMNPNLNYHMLKFKNFKLIPKLDRRDRVFAHVVNRYVARKIGKPELIISNLDRADSILSYSKLSNIVHVIHTTLSQLYKFDNVDESEKLKSRMMEIYAKNPCICVSRGAEEDFIKSFGHITPTTAIHNPIDKDSIQKQAKAFIPEYQNYIIHVGSFKEAKRHDVLVKAYAKTDQSMPLLLLGQGKYKNDIEELVKSLNIEDKVIFLGFQENPFPYIKHAQLKILTSDREGFALVIAEALVLDTPVISTDCPSGPSELLPQKNLMPMGDVDAIADTLSQAMENPKQFQAPFDEALLPAKIAEKYLHFVQSIK